MYIFESKYFLSFKGNIAYAKDQGYVFDRDKKVWYSNDLIFEVDILDSFMGFPIVKEGERLRLVCKDFDPKILKRYGFYFESGKIYRSNYFKDYPDVKFSEIDNVPFYDLSDISLKCKLYSFQEKAVRKMIAAKRCYNASDMGNGKTVMSLASYLYLDSECTKDLTLLVICPASLKENWKQEILKHTNIDEDQINIINGGKKQISSRKVNIINYEILNKHEEIIKVCDVLICDEFHYCKNPGAKRTKTLLKNSEHTPFVFLLSGTPIGSKALDFYTAFLMLKIMKNCDQSYSAFCDLYTFQVKKNFRGRTVKQFVGIKREKEIRYKLYPKFVRFEAKEVKLPDLLQQQVFVNLKSRDLKTLEIMYHEACEVVEDPKTLEKFEQDPHFMRLKSLYAEFKTVQTVSFIRTLLEENPEKQIIVYSDHIASCNLLSLELSKEFKVGLFTGQSRNREQTKKDFIKSDIQVLIGTSALATGHTFVNSSIMVVNDANWSVEINKQLIKRIHRIGQKERCIVYRMCVSIPSEYKIPDFDSLICKALINKNEVIEKGVL